MSLLFEFKGADGDALTQPPTATYMAFSAVGQRHLKAAVNSFPVLTITCSLLLRYGDRLR